MEWSLKIFNSSLVRKRHLCNVILIIKKLFLMYTFSFASVLVRVHAGERRAGQGRAVRSADVGCFSSL